MKTGNKARGLALAGMTLVMSAAALPAAAAPAFFRADVDAPFMVAGRDSGEFQDEREARKSKKQKNKKDTREQERGSGEQGYGYGYERRYPVQPDRFDDRGRR